MPAAPISLVCTFLVVALLALNTPLLRDSSCSQHDKSVSNLLLDRFARSASAHWRPAEWEQLSTLVVVAGHAIFVGPSWRPGDLLEEHNWVLESFQHGQVSTFLKHIEKGVEIAANDTSALLMFSGGQTRMGVGPRSEGFTYWMAAEAANWYGYQTSNVRNRSLAEEYARDSLENLLFSICRFKQVVGQYPNKIKVVSFEFKRVRFVDVHRRAVRFPANSFEFFGIDPEGARKLTAGEMSQAMGPFANDPYGCYTSVLSRKKEIRNPYLRYHPYPQGCPELASLFQYCGRGVYGGPLPWDKKVEARGIGQPQNHSP